MESKKAGAPGSSQISLSGVMPHLALSAEIGPPRSECGVGALMAWAGDLWVVTYVSHKAGSGLGTGLYRIHPDFTIEKHAQSRVGTYTNRMVHHESNQLFIGPHVVDAAGEVRTIDELVDVRLCSTMRHLSRPEELVYMLGMEGEFYEVDVRTLKPRLLSDLTEELHVPSHEYAHFKAAYTGFGRVVVANNSYDERDFLEKESAGRLAEWDGQSKWRIIESSPFVEVTGRGDSTNTIFATGWDRASALLKVYTKGDGQWKTYRLPKGSHTFDHMWQTEWPRIREVDHERFIMDCHGLFYELSPWAYANRVWGIRPVSTHLWVLGDFCTYRGLLILGSDNASPAHGANILAGEPQSGMFIGKTDDLWKLGKPSGWGGPWWKHPVRGSVPSDPYLMTGFDQKVVHFRHDASTAVTFTVETDFLGDGQYSVYDTFTVPPGGYVHHEFPNGYSAHWVRFVADTDCTATVYLTYT